MNKPTYLPIYLLSASLVFLGITSASQAEGASTITQLEKRIKVLEERNQSLNLTSKVLIKWFKELRGCYVPVTVTETNPGVATGVVNMAFCIKE